VLFILDPSEHCGYPMEVQLHLLKEVKGMVTVPLVVVANKSDIAVTEGYLTMSTSEGTGIDEILAEILTHKPERVEEKKKVDILSPLPRAPAEESADDTPVLGEDGKPKRRPKPKRARKPRTRTEGPSS